jgi:sulfite exporter TauE/SafE
MMTMLAGLALGVAGSVHCAAMCGPLVMLAGARRPGTGAVSTGAWVGRTVRYHGARVLVYGVLGSLAGVGGAAIARAGFARTLAVLAGVALLAQAAAALPWASGGRLAQRLSAGVTRVVGAVAAWLRRRGIQGPVALGALNGLLPCGLVYAALTAAAGLGSLPQAVGFMVAFGLGTAPVLVFLGLASGAVTARVPVRIRRAAPAMLAIVGVLLIVRGLRMPVPHDHAASPQSAAVPRATEAPHAVH